MIDISIIVLTWNHLEDVTKPFVASLFRTLEKSNHTWEVIFHDNGSSDGTADWLIKENLPNTKIITSEVNVGFNKGNNRAFQEATGEYVLFMNNDVVFDKENWLELFLQVLRRKEKAIVGAELASSNSLTEWRGKITPYIVGWCFAAPRKAFLEHGLWNEDFGLGYFEDVELSARFSHFGYELIECNPGLTHLGSRSSSDQMDINEYTIVNRALFRNFMYDLEKGQKKRIVFYYPKNWAFTGEDYWEKGVGGSEASLIFLSQELAKRGWIVDIYNSTKVEGNFSGVNYYNLESFDYNDFCDVFVLFRNSMHGLEIVNAGAKFFWSCDQKTTSDWEEQIVPYVEKIITISPYHANYLNTHYPINKEQIVSLDIGINGEEYENQLEKVPGKIVFCSVPRRGLENLLPIYRKIKEKVTHASLYVTSDYTLWGQKDPLNSDYKEMFRGVPDVHFLGKVSREELVYHQKTAEVLAYPGNYDENFCVSAMECIASGAVPVATPIGALTTTVGETGFLIGGKPEDARYQSDFSEQVIKLLSDSQLRKAVSEKCVARSKKYYWSNLVKVWEDMFMSLAKELPRDPECKICGTIFSSSYALFRHRVDAHDPTPIEEQPPETLVVIIETTQFVQGAIGSFSYEGKRIVAPKEMAADIIRVLTDAYGPEIIARTALEKK